MNAIVRIFFRFYRWKAEANFREQEVLSSKYENAIQSYKIAKDAPGVFHSRELDVLFANKDENGLKKKLDELSKNHYNWERVTIASLLEKLGILKNYRDKMATLCKEMNQENMSNFLFHEYIRMAGKTNVGKKEQATVKEIIKIVINIRPPFKIHDSNDLEKWDSHINTIHLPVEYTKSMRKYYKMIDLIYNKIYYLDTKRQ